MSDSDILAAIKGIVEWQSHPAREGAIAWKPAQALESVKRAAVNFTGLEFPIVAESAAQEQRRPHRINEGYEVSFVWGGPGHPRLEYWQVHENGFFGMRREVPELQGEQRLESFSMYRMLYEIASSLQVTANMYSDAVEDNEDIVWRFAAEGLKGRYLATESQYDWGIDDKHRCDTEKYGPKTIIHPLHLFRANTKELASEIMGDLCSFFRASANPTVFVKRVDELFHRFPGLRW